MAGAFLGATLLSSLPTKAAKPITSGLLFGLGMYVFARFYRGTAHSGRVGKPGLALLAPLGFVGGFVDACLVTSISGVPSRNAAPTTTRTANSDLAPT